MALYERISFLQCAQLADGQMNLPYEKLTNTYYLFPTWLLGSLFLAFSSIAVCFAQRQISATDQKINIKGKKTKVPMMRRAYKSLSVVLGSLFWSLYQQHHPQNESNGIIEIVDVSVLNNFSLIIFSARTALQRLITSTAYLLLGGVVSAHTG